jgi:DNA polymerase-4
VPATILHADMDAFYAAVEQRDRPELRGKPVIVGGTGGRGVVTAASYEARVFGVHSAMPMVEARRLCPDGIFLPGRMSRYVEVSAAIRSVFHEFTPDVEPLSLDEAFLDVTASLRLLGAPLDIARRLKARVREATDLTVSVGIGPTKMIAKIASALSKPDGLLLVPPDAVEGFLRPLAVDWLWGVGPVMHARLREAGVATIGDLADLAPAELGRRIGRPARAFASLARGIDPRAVDAGWRRKSYGEENTFARDLVDGDELRRTIVAHAEAVARRLRADRRAARTVVVKIKLAERIAPGKYRLLTRSHKLPAATDDGRTISEAALGLWRREAPGKRVRLIGVSVSGVADVDASQLGLFGRGPKERGAALNRALDAIAGRFGERALIRGGVVVERAAPTGALKSGGTAAAKDKGNG